MSRHAHRARRSVIGRVAPVVGLLLVTLAVPVAVLASGSLPPAADESALSSARTREPVATPTPTSPVEPSATVGSTDGVVVAPGRAQPGLVFQTVQPTKKPTQLAKARRAAEAAAKAKAKAEAAATAPFTFKIGTFNVLGSQHTDADGPRKGYPPASTRTPAAGNLVLKHGLDILGTQELQGDQLRGLQARTGMAAYPGFSWGEVETDNSILYDAGMFELVSGDRFTLTFMGRPRPQPIARFRHLETGREFYVVNTHPSAGGGAYLAQRRQGQAALVSVINNLQETGLPVLVTGDMNDREEFYCRVAPAAGVTAPNGGSYAGGCRPPPSPLPVDWVVGSGVTWSNYWRDTTPVNQRTSDHFIISATANVG